MPTVMGLLLLLSVIAAADVLLFHIVRCRLHNNPASRWEVLTHAGHGISAALIFLLCLVELTGQYTWILWAVLLFQAVNQTVDTVIEPRSRANQGGIPDGEYRLHGVINFLWGAVIIEATRVGWHRMDAPTGARWLDGELPYGLWLLGWAGVIGASAFALFDLYGFWRGPQSVRDRHATAESRPTTTPHLYSERAAEHRKILP